MLNDNQMSIKPNVGAFQLYLNRFRLDPGLTRLREDMERTIARIPAIGARAYSLGKDVKESMKAFLGPGLIFEELGFAYIGVVERPRHRRAARSAAPGHRHGAARAGARAHGQGQGLRARRGAAGRVPRHGAVRAAQRRAQGARRAARPTPRRSAGSLVREARRDPRVVAITAAMTQGTGLEAFEAEFPGRLYDVGIAEEHAVVFAAGLALAGMKPVVAIYSTFLQRAFDMLVQDVALQHIPVVFALDRAGLVGDDGPTHHGAFDLSYLRLIPDLVVMAPSSQAAAAAHDPHRARVTTARSPCATRAASPPRSTSPASSRRSPSAPPRCCARAARWRSSASAPASAWRSRAADLLAEAGVQATVVDARFVKPLDTALLDELADTHARIVTIEENVLAGGFGSAVAEYLADSRVRRAALRPARRASSRTATASGCWPTSASPPEAIAAAVLERQPGLAHIS